MYQPSVIYEPFIGEILPFVMCNYLFMLKICHSKFSSGYWVYLTSNEYILISFQKLTKVFYKRPDTTYFRLCRPDDSVAYV